jgi:hypothetical protein
MEYAIPKNFSRDARNVSWSVSTIPWDWWLAEEGKVGREFLRRPPEKRERLSDPPLQERRPQLADLEVSLISDLRFRLECMKHLYAQRRTPAGESPILRVFNKEQTRWLRTANEGTQFLGKLLRCFDAKVEVVTR